MIEKYEEIIYKIEKKILLEYQKDISVTYAKKQLKDIIQVIDNRGKTPPLTKDYKKHPIIEVANIANNSMIIDIDNCEKYVDDDIYNSFFRAGHLLEGDVLISTVGTIGVAGYNFIDGLSIAQNVVALRSQYSYIIYPYFIINKKEICNLDIGGVQPSIKIPHLLEQEILIPSSYNPNKYEVLYNQIKNSSDKLNKLKVLKNKFLLKFF